MTVDDWMIVGCLNFLSLYACANFLSIPKTSYTNLLRLIVLKRILGCYAILSLSIPPFSQIHRPGYCITFLYTKLTAKGDFEKMSCNPKTQTNWLLQRRARGRDNTFSVVPLFGIENYRKCFWGLNFSKPKIIEFHTHKPLLCQLKMSWRIAIWVLNYRAFCPFVEQI